MLLLCLISLLHVHVCQSKRYEPTWESLDSRPTPAWFDEAKIGIFLHWGVFSVPSYDNAWLWLAMRTGNRDVAKYMHDNYKPNFTYPEFAPDFTAELYDPDYWASVFARAGAKYVVLTSKHHEGFCNWDTKYSFNWNSMDVGPKRDLVGELAQPVRKFGKLRFGLYHSWFDFFHPLFLEDADSNFTTQKFVFEKPWPCLKELMTKYRPEVLWSDGSWMAPDRYWNATDFLVWLFNESPVKDTIAVNDRWGHGSECKHGGYFTCQDRYNPGVLQKHKWENAMTLDRSTWTYRRSAKAEDFLSIEELLKTLATTVSCGGNLLVNTGPRKDGTLDPLMVGRLLQMGEWLGVNGEAVYGSTPWLWQNDTAAPDVWYTAKPPAVYGIVLTWPQDSTLRLGAPQAGPKTAVRLLGFPGLVPFTSTNSSAGMTVKLPATAFVRLRFAWVLKFTDLL